MNHGRGNSQVSLIAFFLLFSFSATTHLSKAANSISAGKSLSPNQTLISKGGIFELGFFTPGNSHNSFIAIWFKQDPSKAAVWIANRDSPISNLTSSQLTISQNGNLILTHSSITIWYSSNLTSQSTVLALLLDTGNLVLRDASNSSIVLWQSFDHPTDTWLPTQRLGRNQHLVSWKNLENPSSGIFNMAIDPNGTAQYFLNKNKTKYWTTGIWNGEKFPNIPGMATDSMLSLTHDEKDDYFSYIFKNSSTIARFMVDVTGQAKIFVWVDSSWEWVCLLPSDPCSVPELCGAFSSCSSETSPFCSCLEGFEPKFAEDWNLSDWSGGCRRKAELQCGDRDGFFMISNVELPINPQSQKVGNFEECESACMSNCSCTAYSYNGEVNCSTWYGQMFDLKEVSNGESSQVVYLRLATTSDLHTKKRKNVSGIIIGVVAGFAACLVILIGMIWSFRTRDLIVDSEGIEGSLVVFGYKDLIRATDNFSVKLGAGGFGEVFKGTLLADSTPIAVKKLGRMGQGEKQFGAEVATIGMIRHLNLVSLRGFCSQGSERLLVYDYMPNGSLDSHLFRSADSKSLTWATRYRIALGIARGLAYLHESCRDCIIHCDVKPENILLDEEFIPKVADFGMAKLVGREFSRVLTTMRGTVGYLAPEWISGVAVTPKADVYSYGMLLLEVVSGRRNTRVEEGEDGEMSFFPVWAAERVRGDDVLGLVDCRLEGKADESEVRRACRVAVWCIQAEESQRPPMSLVVQILDGVLEVNMPPIPKHFY